MTRPYAGSQACRAVAELAAAADESQAVAALRGQQYSRIPAPRCTTFVPRAPAPPQNHHRRHLPPTPNLTMKPNCNNNYVFHNSPRTRNTNPNPNHNPQPVTRYCPNGGKRYAPPISASGHTTSWPVV